MRKILIFTSLLFVLASCKSKKVAVQSDGKTETVDKTEEKSDREIFYTEQVRNDFRTVADKTRDEFLSGYRGTDKKYSTLYLTHGCNSEESTVKNEDGLLCRRLVVTNKNAGLSKSMRILNTNEPEIYGTSSRKTIYIRPGMAGKPTLIY